MKKLFTLGVLLACININNNLEASFTSSNLNVGAVSNPGPGITFNGYNYSTVIMGNGQEWMAENLRTANYTNGEPIPNVTAANKFANKSDDKGNRADGWEELTTGAWAHYNNDRKYENPYGKLYNWYAVNDPRKVCPTGWHVPTHAEWTNLETYLGGNVLAGGKMKSTGTIYWQSPNIAATNESGFSGLPGGYRAADVFTSMGKFGSWWSATANKNNDNDAWILYLDMNRSNTVITETAKTDGQSVRCLKD